MRTNTTRMQPSTTANDRLWIAVWMKFAWRKMCVLMWIPGRPGCSSRNALRIPFVTSSVLAPGNFSITSMIPGPPLTTAVPISGEVP